MRPAREKGMQRDPGHALIIGTLNQIKNIKREQERSDYVRGPAGFLVKKLFRGACVFHFPQHFKIDHPCMKSTRNILPTLNKGSFLNGAWKNLLTVKSCRIARISVY